MSRSRILILSFSTIASDARVLKQVKRLADDYDVTTCGYGPAPDPRVRHLRLDDTAGIRSWTRRDLVARRYSRIYWNQPGIMQAQAAMAEEAAFDVILANDVDTVGLALRLQPRFGVHADIHEYAPRQNEELLIWRWFEAPYMRWMCRRFLTRATSMTTVGQGIADEYKRVFGLDAGVVTNAAPFVELAPREVGKPIRLVHSGASLRNRRLEVLIDAVQATSTEVTLDLLLMGNDPEYVTELHRRAQASDRVRFPDAVPYHALIQRLNDYDAGVHVMPPTNFNNRWALPNKFFDYVQARLALVIGPSSEMKSRLEEHGLGAVTDDFSTEALTRVLDAMTADQVAQWKSNSDAAATELSSELQVEVWVAAIAALVERDRR